MWPLCFMRRLRRFTSDSARRYAELDAGAVSKLQEANQEGARCVVLKSEKAEPPTLCQGRDEEPAGPSSFLPLSLRFSLYFLSVD
mmetsp:Transcript_14402/g.43633  ORF Transcript_14402/g.43633 Transcript_14402/m.43633 type:complete len:85 (+) Transcript_14402:553-807(+)